MVLGLIGAAFLAYYGEVEAREIGTWAAIVFGALLLVVLMVWLVARLLAWRSARRVEAMLQDSVENAVPEASPHLSADMDALRARMREAVKQIKSSRMGVLKGNAALYELPWYLIIGNPAAGKTTAVVNSGLQFPFLEGGRSAVQGVGGTRNCDWYFSGGGIVIDTAGRYSVNVEDRNEWLAFLGLLKKSRRRAPINGIIVAASIAEVANGDEAFAIGLATTLRQRLQEITERLEVVAPVYVLFTKADLIAGFSEFFRTIDAEAREQVWGATFPYATHAEGSVEEAFTREFDLLVDGLKERSLSELAKQRGGIVSPGLLSLPLEFIGIRPALRRFIATLFEDNPYQFKPVFRGFYFSSALQDGYSVQQATARVSMRFSIAERAVADHGHVGQTTYFLKDLFNNVVFGDRGLVRQYASPRQRRLRYIAFFFAAGLLTVLMGLWTWSYTGNVQLVSNAGKDLVQAARMQQGRVDLKSRMDALLLLQDRMEQMDRIGAQGGMAGRLGLYQGEAIRRKLFEEYVHGLRQVMLVPTVAGLERYLGKVVTERMVLGRAPDAPIEAASLYREASPTNLDDAYSALKAYLMLGNPDHVEPAHLAHQLTMFWRGWLDANRGQMPREEMVRNAERLMRFYVLQAPAGGWLRVETNVSLVADVRAALSQVMKGQPAMARVLAQIKARAAARFPTITVDTLVGAERNGQLISGSHVISGAFSKAAWEGYVSHAINEAANAELSTTDWVLGTTERNDLSLAGSPEHVSRELARLYKQAYAIEWDAFIGSLSIDRFADFDAAVVAINRLGDGADSPLRVLLEGINAETAWDSPRAVASRRGGHTGVGAWFRRAILRRPAPTDTAAAGAEGPISRRFQGLARLMTPGDGQPAIIDAYFDQLTRLRSRLNAIRSQGDVGAGARMLMNDTFANGESELVSGMAVVDDQLLGGLDKVQGEALRSLLLRPLTETFAAIVVPVQDELDRIWNAQVYQPFNGGIARQYPFTVNADVDAAPREIAQIFGPTGAIAVFNKEVLESLVIQRGNLLQPKLWAGIGIELSSELIANYGDWISGDGTAKPADATIFEVRPAAAVGAIDYTLEIDGQVLRYQRTAAQWTTMQYPNPGQVSSTRITATTQDGRRVDVFTGTGSSGFSRLMNEARYQRIEGGSRLGWSRGGVSVAVDMRIIRRPEAGARGRDWQRGLKLPAAVAGEGSGNVGSALRVLGTGEPAGEPRK